MGISLICNDNLSRNFPWVLGFPVTLDYLGIRRTVEERKNFEVSCSILHFFI